MPFRNLLLELRLEGLDLVGLLPGEVGPAEVAVGRGRLVDGPLEVQRGDDSGGRAVEDLLDCLLNLGLGDGSGSEGVAHDGHGEGNADRVGKLYLTPFGKACGDDVLGDVAGHVCRRAVHLAGVLAGECAAAVTGISAVSIDDDLSAGQAGVALRTADDEAAGRVDEVLGLVIEEAGGLQDGLYELADDRVLDLGVADSRVVLLGDDDRVNPDGLVALVFYGDLGLAVGAEPGNLAFLAQLRRLEHELVSKHNRGGHELRGLLAGEAEHHSLVSRALLALELVETLSDDALVDVGGLVVDHVQDGHGVVVKAVVRVGISDSLGDVARNLLHVNVCFGGNLAADKDQGLAGERLRRHVALRVLLEAFVKDSVADLVAELVGVSLANGLRCEKIVPVTHTDLQMKVIFI